MSLDSMKEIFDRMAEKGQPFWEVVLEDDMETRQVTRNQSMAKMLLTWQAMVDAADSYTGRKRSVSGLVGGDGMKMRQYAIRGEALSGGYVSEVITEALSMAESNACMRRIVAAPTAGACGVLPAVMLPLCKYEELNQHQILEALYVASGIGAVNAVSVADMALAGIESRIPVDEVIDAMGEVGRRMPVEFRETALGGLAATPTGRAIKKRMHKHRRAAGSSTAGAARQGQAAASGGAMPP